jgi:PAS domain S-box-containing protein
MPLSGDGSSRSEPSLAIRVVVDRIPAFVWSTHSDGSVEFVKQRWREYAGLSLGESQRWGWQVAIHQDDLPSLMHKWRQRLPSGEAGDIEARLRRHDGVFRWFLTRFEPFQDETGKIAMWYGVSTDIENLKQTEEKLREDERELRQITDAIPQAVVVQDPVGLPIYANRAALDYTGLSADDVMAPNFRERIFHSEDVEKFRNERKAALAPGVPFEFEHRVFLTAARYGVDAAVAYHGGDTAKYLGEVDGLHAPLLIHLAEEDEFISEPAQAEIKAALASKPNPTVYGYPGQNHAFSRHNGAHYNAAAAALAQERTNEFLQQQLR